MKKKLSALLLGLVLTLVLLTVTAWAAEPRTPTLNDVDPTIQVKFVCKDYKSLHTHFLDLSADYARIEPNGEGWNLVINRAAALRAYYVQHGDNGPHEIIDGVVDTIPLTWDDSSRQWKNKSEQTLTIPINCILFPDETGLQSLLGQVTLQCTHDSSHTERFDILHSSYGYPSSVSYEHGVFTRQVRIKLEDYLKNINELNKYAASDIHHIIADGPDKIDLTLQYDVATDKWSISSGNSPLVFKVTCEKPALPDFDYSKLSVKLSNAGTYQDCGTIPLNESLIDWDHSGYGWNSSEEFWSYDLAIKSEKLLADYNAQHNTNYLLVRDGTIWSEYKADTKTWDISESAYFTVAPAPSVNDLGLTANVACKDSKHTLKSFTLDDNNQLTFTRVWNEKGHCYEYRVSLTDAAASGFVKQYNIDIGTNHTKQSVTYVTMCWDDGDGGVSMLSLENSAAVQAETVPPKKGWNLTSKIITVTAACTSGGTHTGPAKNPYKPETTVTSAKTFDGGVALYAGLTLLSLTGTALTVRRKER